MAIHLENVKKQYVAPDGAAVPVIDIAEFSIGDAEQVALVGTSGSGKTTLLHMIAGILTPDTGRILFTLDDSDARTSGFRAISHASGAGGFPVVSSSSTATDIDARRWIFVNGMPEAQRDIFRGRFIGYIFQTHHLLPGFTALENVLLGMSFTGRPHDRGWARHLLSEVGLSDRLNYKPEKLSVGQQQRVAVARALANRPKLVLADEPTGALDAKNAQQVLDLIRALCDEVKASLLLVSHDRDIAQQLPRVVELAEMNEAKT